jgi:type IV pilus assembly protein PilV
MLIRRQAGTSMIEVLVSIVIIVLGLLGLAGLQSHAALAEAEAFQRSQAVVLLQDMADRINANRLNSSTYKTSGPLGTGGAVEDCTLKAVGAARDHCEWSNALLGSTESAGGVQVGAMTDARGCVTEVIGTMPREYEVAVVWQGVTPTKAHPSPCGVGLYGDDKYRRVLVTTVRVGCLFNAPQSNACIFPP